MQPDLKRGGKRQWFLLGSAVLGLTCSVTVLALFLPLIIANLTDSRLAVGFAVGVEGVVALTIPVIVGQASDGTWNRFGRRLPYMLAATPVVVGGLLAVAFLHSYWAIVGAVVAYFIGYYTYYTAYQSLYPDTLPDNEYGRAWAYQSIFQGVGVGLALLGGGALLGVSLKAPFIAAAGVFLLVTAGTMYGLTEDRRHHHRDTALHRAAANFWRRLRTDRKLRLFLAAHFCWEFTLAGIRAFVLLYLLKGLGLTTEQLLPVLGVIILVYLIASVISGYVADAYDPRRYTAWVIALYAIVMAVTGLTTNLDVLEAVLPFGMFAGAAVLMLSYPIMLRVTPADRRGEYTGYYQFNRGLALLAGTSLTGFMIDRVGGSFPATGGYQVLWLTTAAFAALSLPFFLALTRKRP